MGYRGPAPKPTAIEIQEGRPGHRALNRREPKVGVGEPKRPEFLDKEAVREWRQLVPILLSMKVLTPADGIALGNLCQSYSTMVKAQEKLNELGVLYKSPSGYVMQSPLLAVVNRCVEQITKLSREFGLTPAARTRIAAEADSDLSSRNILSVVGPRKTA